jgi:hypothetical protein
VYFGPVLLGMIDPLRGASPLVHTRKPRRAPSSPNDPTKARRDRPVVLSPSGAPPSMPSTRSKPKRVRSRRRR